MQSSQQPADEILLNEPSPFGRSQQLELRNPRGERVPEGAELHPGQSGSHAEMSSGAKRQVLARVGTSDAQGVWLREAHRVTVRGAKKNYHPRCRNECLAAKPRFV